MEFKVYLKQLEGDSYTPITLFQKYVGCEKGFLLESNHEEKGRYSFIAKNPFAELKGMDKKIIIKEGDKITEKNGKIMNILREYMSNFKIKNHSSIPFAGGAVGTVGYDIVRQYEKLPKPNKDTIKVPDVHLMFTKEIIAYDNLKEQVFLMVLEEDNEEGKKKAEEKIAYMERELQNKQEIDIPRFDNKNIKKITSNMTDEEYMDKVKKAKKYIYEGDIFQVVLSKRWVVEADIDSFLLYRKLRKLNPSPYLFYLNFGEYQVIGSSPEMLVELRKDKIYNCPIAGTRKRGKDKKEDELLSKELLNDEKEKAEHIMLVDLARNDMGRVAKIDSVSVKNFMEVHYYSHVMHLVSLVEGTKKEGEDAFSILHSFLPAGTLSGAPKIRAMEIIDELEEEKRGIYGGAVGYFGFDGDMDMCIAIRTMIKKEGRIYMQAGAGIVADSDPKKENEESENKVKALLKVLE
ncbi:anthranilate synthase component I [Defluviitalea phaphyphila]|uniref:anthranilate synthase component I n=1 Tax=Defluviitalea phaphyphila TaxID=1473580 RepID=UPI000731D7C3|nr:anthranilate synthase component I [Defluviitalea phaphyphila]